MTGVTQYRLTVRGNLGETLEVRTGEASTDGGTVVLPLGFPRVGSIEIEWTRERSEEKTQDLSDWSAADAATGDHS